MNAYVLTSVRRSLMIASLGVMAGVVAADSAAIRLIADLDGDTRGIHIVDATEAWVAVDDSIVSVDLLTGISTPVTSGLPLAIPARLLAGDPDGIGGNDLLVSDWNTEVDAACCNGRVFTYDGTFTQIYDGGELSKVGDPFGLAHSPGGSWAPGLYVLDFQGASKETPFVARLDGTGSSIFAQDASIWTTSSSPFDMMFPHDPAFGDFLYVTERTTNELHRVSPTGDITSFAPVGTTALWALEFGDDPCTGEPWLYTLTSNGVIGTVHQVAPDGTATQIGTGMVPDGSSVLSSDLARFDDRRMLATHGAFLYEVRLCGADLDNDCEVGTTDLLDVLATWGGCSSCEQDFNADGQVDVGDLLFLLACWGPCGS